MLPPYQGTEIDLNKLEVMWRPLEGIKLGGSTLYSYNLQYDQGKDEWLDVIGDDT